MNGASIKNKDVFLEGGDVDLNDLWVEAVPNFQAVNISNEMFRAIIEVINIVPYTRNSK